MLATYPSATGVRPARAMRPTNVVPFPRVRTNPEYGWTADGSMIVRRSDGLLIHPSAWVRSRS